MHRSSYDNFNVFNYVYIFYYNLSFIIIIITQMEKQFVLVFFKIRYGPDFDELLIPGLILVFCDNYARWSDFGP